MQTSLSAFQKGRILIRVCRDKPDWNQYIWANPKEVIYGPVSSRRLGWSLGVNLFPSGKVCNFQCLYCDLDISEANEEQSQIIPFTNIKEIVETKIVENIASNLNSLIDSVTFSGNGDPTLYPDFFLAVEFVEWLRQRYFKRIPLHLFTAGLNMTSDDVKHAAKRFQRIFLKIDGSFPETVNLLNGPNAWNEMRSFFHFAQTLSNISASTMIVRGKIDNSEDVKSQNFASRINELKPQEVFLYTLDYPCVNQSIYPVSLNTLEETAHELSRNIECPIIVLWRKYCHPSIRREND